MIGHYPGSQSQKKPISKDEPRNTHVQIHQKLLLFLGVQLSENCTNLKSPTTKIDDWLEIALPLTSECGACTIFSPSLANITIIHEHPSA
uniref:Uncharacterized protein n=1 Tax=Oryza brachyantha TaxID=4533 RepID=J3L094_ORYBR